jgi:hypothetical protein
MDLPEAWRDLTDFSSKFRASGVQSPDQTVYVFRNDHKAVPRPGLRQQFLRCLPQEPLK